MFLVVGPLVLLQAYCMHTLSPIANVGMVDNVNLEQMVLPVNPVRKEVFVREIFCRVLL